MQYPDITVCVADYSKDELNFNIANGIPNEPRNVLFWLSFLRPLNGYL